MNKEYYYLGKIVNTHGIKGELRILSNFEKKDLVFKKRIKIYIGPEKQEEEINTYRQHKNFDMITLKNYNNINEVLKYKNAKVYFKKSTLNLKDDDYLLEELIDLEIYENEEFLGKITDIVYTKNSILLYISYTKNYYIPYLDNYIEKVDLKNKRVIVKNAKGLIL